jgi:hypothetical protein
MLHACFYPILYLLIGGTKGVSTLILENHIKITVGFLFHGLD